MNPKKPYFVKYNKFLINKQTVTPDIRQHIETLNSDDDAPKHFAFHKIMINNWPTTLDILFDILSEYFTCALIPVSPSVQDEITSFYTNNLNFILKIIKLDFNFLYERIIVNIDIIYNDKTSVDFFNKYETLIDVVSSVVSQRFENRELDLSDFCNDAEFLTKKIYFYKLTLLSHFKIMMLRIGKETKSLNLSRNNLWEPPSSILNFFMKGDLSSINLSYNNIKSLNQLFSPEMYCYKSKLEKLWLEGNPLCEDLDPLAYVKSLRLKFPKLVELDGIKLNPKTALIPFIRNYLVTPNHSTKAFVEEFLSLYFCCYDHPTRSKLLPFYSKNATLSLTTNSPTSKELRNSVLEPPKKSGGYSNYKYIGRTSVLKALQQCPKSLTDRDSLTIDVLFCSEKCVVLVLDGMHIEPKHKENHFTFRRTFTFEILRKRVVKCLIMHEMFTLTHTVRHNIENTITPLCRHPIALKSPDAEEIEALLKIFTYLTCLKSPEAKKRLRDRQWDIRRALMLFNTDLKANKIPPDHFLEVEDMEISDSDSVMDMVD
ncbi:nuclear RNA export factor 1 isoform X2 [Manduca sexta]|uniref:Uncharacterized protein n=1 Tax=Manduca sexta TaxID=7130 RepID=A0A921ZTG8_MANSE|nr:nuclear RNA export factor 1 isoform X2 [Manduca sexta]KAG6462953.1 hypothetical protein O3G_MSEX013565 [Manduca sexta]